MVMTGALFQMTSVVGGHLLPGGARVAAVVYGGLTVGSVLFLMAMIEGRPMLFLAAACSLVLAVGVLAVCGLIAIKRARRYTPTLMSMKLSLVSLLVMISVGAGLLLMYGYSDTFGFDRRWTDFHLLWALAGWVGLLIMGVSFQVIPMFHVTPSFNIHFQRGLPVVTFISLIAASLSGFLYPKESLFYLFLSLLLICFFTFSVYVWRLLNQRKRKLDDVTVSLWRVAVISFLAFIILQAASTLVDVESDQVWLLSGVLLVYGGVMSVIGGMLQKIIPFLSYLHMQRFCAGDFNAIKALPHMRAILKQQHSKYFYRLHVASLALLSLMMVVPQLTVLAGLVVCVEFMLLFYMVARVAVMVKRAENKHLAKTVST